MHPKTRKILYSLGLSRIFSAVFAKANESILGKLQRVEPYVTYGYGNHKTSYISSFIGFYSFVVHDCTEILAEFQIP